MSSNKSVKKKTGRRNRRILMTVSGAILVIGIIALLTLMPWNSAGSGDDYVGTILDITALEAKGASGPAVTRFTYNDMLTLNNLKDDSEVAEATETDALVADARYEDYVTDNVVDIEKIKARTKEYSLNDTDEGSMYLIIASSSPSSSGGSSQEMIVDTSRLSSGSYLGRFVITGYCPCAICCGVETGITASGKRATSNHTIAADRRFTFGTQLAFNNHVYTVEDRGGAIVGNHIDLYFDTHQEALNWGKRYFDVYLYTGESAPAASRAQASGKITMVGDSLGVGAKSGLESRVPGISINAEVGRQYSTGAGIISDMCQNGTIGDTVIIELGTNGPFSVQAGQDVINKIGSGKQIYFVTVAGVSWAGDVNNTINKLAQANSNVHIIDWAGAVSSNPGLLSGDGVHPTGSGYSKLVDVIAKGIGY